VAQKFHFAILQIEVTRASRGLSAIAELLVNVALQAAVSSCAVCSTVEVQHMKAYCPVQFTVLVQYFIRS